MLAKLKSRKLWVAVITAAVVALAEQLGLDPDQVTSLLTVAVAYIAGQGFADAARDFSLPPRASLTAIATSPAPASSVVTQA